MGRKEKVTYFKKEESSLETIAFENITCWSEIKEPVLLHVDFELPADQTVIVKSSNPLHAIQFLEVLAGRKFPETGRVLINDQDRIDLMYNDEKYNSLLGCYFENERAVAVNAKVSQLISGSAWSEEQVSEALEHFGILDLANKNFFDLSYENQKIILLLSAIKNNPEMLILEDPASGLSELYFLNFLDFIQFQQRRGHLRHIFLTNCHPTAEKKLIDATLLYVEDGFLYQEELLETKKAVHF